MDDQLLIAFFAAVPTDQVRLQVAAEFKSIETELERSPHSERFDLRFVPATGRRDLLSRLLKVKPHIIHFSGHGTESDELIFETGDGRSETVGPSELKDLFDAIPPAVRPRVVVLNACYSEGQALAIADALDCAIGMSSAIPDDDALSFASGFYSGLGHGLSIEAAVQAGRFAMSHDHRTMPQLHAQDASALADVTLIGQGPVNSFPDNLHIDRTEELACFEQMLSTGRPKVLLVKARGNMGKSTLITRMRQRASDLAAAVGVADLTAGTPSPMGILDSIAIGIGSTVSPDDAQAPERPGSVERPRAEAQATRRTELLQMAGTLLDHADRLAADKGARVALLIDGYNETDGDVATFVETVLLPRVVNADQVVCVVAGRESPRMLTGGAYEAHELSNFAEAHLREAMQQLRLNSSPDVTRTLWVHSCNNGDPFATMQALRRQWNDAIGRRS